MIPANNSMYYYYRGVENYLSTTTTPGFVGLRDRNEMMTVELIREFGADVRMFGHTHGRFRGFWDVFVKDVHNMDVVQRSVIFYYRLKRYKGKRIHMKLIAAY
jgi:hypothetical protein